MSEIDNTDDIAKRLPYVRPTLITISSKAAQVGGKDTTSVFGEGTAFTGGGGVFSSYALPS